MSAPVPELQHAIAEVLTHVERPGSFYATGTLDIHLPGLSIDGVGRLALPLLPVQAAQLIAIAEKAPYGRGTETLVNTEVRRTWQIDAAHIRAMGRRWATELASIVRAVADGLGVRGQVQAEPYKLLIYDTGSFFVSHRNSEKAPGISAPYNTGTVHDARRPQGQTRSRMQTPKDSPVPDQDAERAARAAARGVWPVRCYALGQEPAEDLTATTTPAERIAMVWQLTLDTWALSGMPIPDYPREQSPGRVLRPAHGSRAVTADPRPAD